MQAITRDQLPADQASQWQQAAAALVAAAVPDDPDLPPAWAVCGCCCPTPGLSST